jgi:hypothetical protein
VILTPEQQATIERLGAVKKGKVRLVEDGPFVLVESHGEKFVLQQNGKLLDPGANDDEPEVA